MQKKIQFALIGVSGFLVDAAILKLLLFASPLDAYSARIIAIALAMIVTWTLNRTLTFGPSGRTIVQEAARYGGVGISGSVLNYAIYAAAIFTFPQMNVFIALVFASGTVMAFSWMGYSKFVFQQNS